MEKRSTPEVEPTPGQCGTNHKDGTSLVKIDLAGPCKITHRLLAWGVLGFATGGLSPYLLSLSGAVVTINTGSTLKFRGFARFMSAALNRSGRAT
jgi:hypothetical protein